MIHFRDNRLHDQQREKERQPDQHLIGRCGLGSERLPQEMEHDGDPQKRGHGHNDRRKNREQREQHDDLHRHAQAS